MTNERTPLDSILSKPVRIVLSKDGEEIQIMSGRKVLATVAKRHCALFDANGNFFGHEGGVWA